MVCITQARSLLKLLKVLRHRPSEGGREGDEKGPVITLSILSSREVVVEGRTASCHAVRVVFETPMRDVGSGDLWNAPVLLDDLLAALAFVTLRSSAVFADVLGDCLVLACAEEDSIIQTRANIRLIYLPDPTGMPLTQREESSVCRFEGDCRDLLWLLPSTNPKDQTAAIDTHLHVTSEHVQVECQSETLLWHGLNDFRSPRSAKFGHVAVKEPVKVDLPGTVIQSMRAILTACKTFRIEVFHQRLLLSAFAEFDGETTGSIALCVT